MTDYHLQTPSRLCHVTGRPLRPGEEYVGAVVETGGRFARLEFGPDAWPGPPAGTVGHWAGRVPAGEAPVRPPADDETLLECFRRLDGAGEPSRVNFRYVLALLLVRRKVLRLECARRDELGETLVLQDRGGDRHEARDPGLGESGLATAQDEVFRLLGWE